MTADAPHRHSVPRQPSPHLQAPGPDARRDAAAWAATPRPGVQADGRLLADAGDGLAEALFTVAHDPDSGRPLVSDVALGIGLAGALLVAELASGRAELRDGLVIATTNSYDGLCWQFATALSTSPPAGPGVWLRVLADETAEWILEGLLSRKVWLIPDKTLLRRRPAPRPADPTAAEWAAVVARNQLSAGPRATTSDAALAGLIRALDLHHHWLRDHPGQHEPLKAVVRRLPQDLFDLLALVEHTIASTALTPRS